MSQNARKLRLLPLLHVLVILGIAVWWGAYFWENTPSREVFRLRTPTRAQAVEAPRRPGIMPKLDYLSGTQSRRFAVAVRAALGDLAGGVATLVLFGLASGVYVRRLDTWLSARTSGQAVAFRGQDLTAAALDANAKKQRGILR